jgi:long-chain acyl-CoA synthetase
MPAADVAAIQEDISRAVDGATFTQRFHDAVVANPDTVAIRWLDGDGWAGWTWREYADRACRFARSLQELGVQAGDRVVLLMENRREFHVADIGALLAGATPLSLYATSAAEQVAYMTRHCGAVLAVCGGRSHLERMERLRKDPGTIRKIVMVEDEAELAPDLMPFAELLTAEPVDLAEAAHGVKPDDLLTILYTSGTTGLPKGVRHTHRNFAWALESIRRAMRSTMAGWRLISFLPMAHVSERLFGHYGHLTYANQITICPRISELDSFLADVHPQSFASVPRIWEKLQKKLDITIRESPQQVRLQEAMSLGQRVHVLATSGKDVPRGLREEWAAAEAEVLRPVKAAVGLDECYAAYTGSAPTPRHIFDFFLSLGIPLQELYGMSESPVATGWDFTAVRLGTVGRAAPGVELRLSADGEVLLRGRQLSTGYYDDAKATVDAYDAGEWLHTGDLGTLDEDGYLRIVGRRKELIITSGGKNISPAAVEGPLKQIPLVGQVAVVGDGRLYLTALICLDAAATAAWTRQRGIEFTSMEMLARSPLVRAELERRVHEVNRALSRPEQVKKFHVVAEEWTPESGEVTMTMKLRRSRVLDKYAEVIDRMYED